MTIDPLILDGQQVQSSPIVIPPEAVGLMALAHGQPICQECGRTTGETFHIIEGHRLCDWCFKEELDERAVQ